MGTEYWSALVAQLDDMVTHGTINREDLDLLLVTDSVDEAVAHVKRCAVERFKLHRRLTPIRALGEHARP
jgi:predicted Rossmann-fold nucleotide-binding protein